MGKSGISRMLLASVSLLSIEEGATMVRVGTGIFGERDYSNAN